ncbi:MAG: hypothetical protein QF714_14700 [Dehalococcoidia bacterium]|nr:hypothetical protein [Dehalococcoidia bacterium]MDP6228932.1 hypothetical protein [Dehalococcoidia bacterium]MDP7083196.1 hypothetical protein [Dehalococcoidia bacterium]MDP7199924.1 hypothetical protein [Dehalococcoidia bacterium]MDP7510433.1 hypothetical protein [Dehalococcoidia bacterium]
MIVFTGVLTMVALVVAVMVFRLYRPLRRTTQNLEVISDIFAERVARPLSNIPALLEVVKYAVGWVQGLRPEERRGEDGEVE